jgi:hypothetical protein
MGGRITTPTIDAVERCTQFAAAQAHEAGFSLARVREIELVVEEVVSNICGHSYGDHPGSVELSCERLDGANLALEFIDYGRPFDILLCRYPILRWIWINAIPVALACRCSELWSTMLLTAAKIFETSYG